MPSPDYHRPQTLAEAMNLMRGGTALGGGTRLSREARRLASIVDLQALGLDGIEDQGGEWVLGANVRLQALVESDKGFPPALVAACRLEAGPNLRNMATLAGTIMAAGGRSALVTALLALEARVGFKAETIAEPLDALLGRRRYGLAGRLIVAIRFARSAKLAYEQVARSPADRPIVCAAVSRGPGRAGLVIAIGGFGERPILVADARAAEWAYARAEDAWASAEYRSAVAGVLVRRLAAEVA
jgi:CO/xanthine dehydrogenase FAD-binding subunit